MAGRANSKQSTVNSMMLATIKRLLKPYAGSELLRSYHKLQAMLATIYYGFPARRLRTIGVTGTKGKTTTTHMIGAIMQAGGYETAIASTVSFQIGDQREHNALNMTTPSAWIVQQFLAKAVKAGAHMAVIETTSHALEQARVWGIKYDTVVFTNLSHDHLDYHGTMDNYRAAKLKLFADKPRLAVINIDDPAAQHFLAKDAVRQLTFGIDGRADVTARKILLEPAGSLFTVVTPVGQIAINLQLPGRFNIYNALAAIAVGVGHGLGLETIKVALENLASVPGRMERIDVGQDFTVLIDYAHTPDSFEKVYETLKPVTRGRLIHVFGATGDRDKTKRPIMGALAARSADLVILTTDEPYTERPEQIIEEIAQGIKRGRAPVGNRKKKTKESPETTGEGSWWWQVVDRREAIEKALAIARKGDVVLITGMGDERWMTVSDERGDLKRLPWNERRIVKDLLLNQISDLSAGRAGLRNENEENNA